MPLIAIAGGAAPAGEDCCSCCGMFIVLPWGVYLAWYAVVCRSIRAAGMALLLVGVPWLFVEQMVAGYLPSTDRDVQVEQATGLGLLTLYRPLMALAVVAAVWVAGRRLISRLRRDSRQPRPTNGAS